MINNQKNGCTGRCPAPLKRNPLDRDGDIPLAMAYVKDGGFGRIFDPGKALSVGTVFPELYKPFYGNEANTRQCQRRTYR